MIKRVDLETGDEKELFMSDFFKYLDKASIKVLKTYWVKLRRSNSVVYQNFEYTFPVQYVPNILTYIKLTFKERGEQID